jgi:hypothetical protein
LHAFVGDVQLLLSLPLTPFTYHVALATAVGARNRDSSSVVVESMCVMGLSPLR